MICEPCKQEADFIPPPGVDPGIIVFTSGHMACKGGTHCFCQHKPVGSHLEVKK